MERLPIDSQQLIREASETSNLFLANTKITLVDGKACKVFDTKDNPLKAKYDLTLRAAAPNLGGTPNLRISAELDKKQQIRRVEICLSTKDPQTGKIEPWISLFLPKDKEHCRPNYESAVYWRMSKEHFSFSGDTMKIPSDAIKFTYAFFPCLRAAESVLRLKGK